MELWESHDDRLHAFWRLEWVKQLQQAFLGTGGQKLTLVKAYSKEVMDAKISEIPTKMYGPDTIRTLREAGFGVPSSLVHAEGWLS